MFVKKVGFSALTLGFQGLLALGVVACSPDDGSSSGGVLPTAPAGTLAIPTAGTIAGGGTAGRAGTPAVGTAGAPPITGMAGRGPIGPAGAPGGTAGAPPAIAGVGAPPPAGAPGGAAGGGAAGMMAGAAGAAGGPVTPPPPPPPPTGDGPMLPAVMGECPNFQNGMTIAIGGHGGVAISAGEKGKGGPLLFYWHGTGGSASEAMRTLPAGVRMDIISSGGIIAAFNGRQQASGGGDCSGTAAHSKNDFNAADQIAACAVKNHGIDPRRIYSTGCSAGGLQSGCMAMVRSSYLAAAAPNSGGIVGAQPWQSMHSPAIFTMHGGSSDVVIVTFSQTSARLDMAAKQHGSFVVNCDHGGGHCAAPAALQSAAWEFMKAHPWGTKMSPWAGGIPSGIPSSCKIY